MSCEPSIPKFVHENEEDGQRLSKLVGSEKTLPPPNRFKKNNNQQLISDPDHLRHIQAYKRTHRRESVEIDHELYTSPSSSPKLNANDWRSVFQMGTVLRELLEISTDQL
mmetsp:Transcript_58281/g.121766  ORF Transcript_58281/g.121766 Transcript_58281/m.121766 type:complete len:110 (-) Transcript_58281:20-349(-)